MLAVFRHEEIHRAVLLQEKSYRLLRWVQQRLRTSALKFDQVHQAMSISDAAEQWLRRHWNSLPHDARPQRQEDLEPFAHLLASYLATSFELKPQDLYWESYCGCRCRWCSYLVAGPRLKAKKVTKKARREAEQLKTVYLQGLAQSLGRNLPQPRLEELAAAQEHQRQVSLATYGNELVRRTRFASQGEGILVLWREIAWKDNHPIKDFRLQADEMLQAQEHLLCAIRQG